MKDTGQIFTWDLIFGIIIFMVSLSLVINLWETSYKEIRRSEEYYEMNWLAETAAEQLVRSSGDPYDWNAKNAISLGLARYDVESGTSQSRLLDPDKVLSFIDLTKKNYSEARARLLGTGGYEMYIELSCLNATGMSCLEGVALKTVKESVSCLNDTSIHVNKLKGMTDSYAWFEAEDLWGNAKATECWQGCSKNNMSQTDNYIGDDLELKLKPNTYNIWVRVLEKESNAKLVIDGIEHPIFNVTGDAEVGLMRWNWLGEQSLGPVTTIGLRDSDIENWIDALLFTTDTFYNPNNPPEYAAIQYGNPNSVGSCALGRPSTGSDSISVMKTAVIGASPTSQDLLDAGGLLMDNVLGIRITIWAGQAMEPKTTTTTTSTTTTTLPDELVCDKSPLYGCISSNRPVIAIKNITLWGDTTVDGTIICNRQKEFTIHWRGRHAGTPNYWAFFLDDAKHFVGSCQSNNTKNEALGVDYDYNMNCTVTLPAELGVADGEHDFIVVGEDYKGWCYPGNLSADSETSTKATVKGCVQYARLQCLQTDPTKVVWDCVGGDYPKDTVSDINRMFLEGNKIKCGQPSLLEVYWEGNHGTNDNKVQWTYMLNLSRGYTCLNTCQSTEIDGAGINFYNMTCPINLEPGPGCSIKDGDIRQLIVVAETYSNRYCKAPTSPEAEAVKAITIGIDCPAQSTVSSSPGTSSGGEPTIPVAAENSDEATSSQAASSSAASSFAASSSVP
jgi:hypothetical protein